jgi:Mrp family chromosome partitioning ATPase
LALQRAYLLIIGILLMGSAAFIWSCRQVVLYQASASVVVLDQLHPSSGDPVSGISYAANLAKYAARAITPTMVFQVEERVPQRGAAQIRDEVHLAAVSGQPLITVTALDSDAKIAMALANNMASVLALDDTIGARQGADQQVANLQAQVNTLSGEVNKTTNAIAVARRNGQPVDSLQAQLQSQQTQLYQLQIQLAQAQRDAASVQPTYSVSSVALSTSSNAPNLPLNIALGSLSGLLAGLGLAEMIDLLDGVVRGPEDFLRLEKVIPLGEVPDAPTDEIPFALPDDMAAVSQPFRSVWKHLQFLSGGPDGQVSLVLPVSSVSDDGWVGINLAAASAQTGQRTLLLDANWRHPTVEHYFQFPVSQQGFLTSLASPGQGPSPFTPLPAVKTTGIPHLFVLPAGSLPPDEEGLAQPDALADFFALLRRDFARIIVLSPPDALYRANGFLGQMNAVLLIARSKHTTVAEIKALLPDLERTDGPFLGAVLLVSKPDAFSPSHLETPEEAKKEDEPVPVPTYHKRDTEEDRADG